MRLLSRLVRLPLRLVPNDRMVRIVSGPLRGWKWVTGSATHGCWLGTYEREAQQLMAREVEAGDVVFDIGANVGFFTLLASKLVGNAGAVYAFEPLPRNLDYLQRHLRANGAANVHVRPAAVSSASGRTRFHTAANPAMGGLRENGDLEVAVESLDELVRSGAVRRPSFLKIDVEGAEYDVLSGAQEVLSSGPGILLSTHGWEQHERCLGVFNDAGYAVQLIRDGSEDGNYVVFARPRK